MYLAHICVLRDYVGFRYKKLYDLPKSLKYPLKIQNKGIYNLSKSCDKVF